MLSRAVSGVRSRGLGSRDEAAKDVVYLRKLTSGLGDAEPGPTPLATDSQSARDVSYNPEHHDRMKHVQRRLSKDFRPSFGRPIRATTTGLP